MDTALVRAAIHDDSLGQRFHELIPQFLHKTITPDQAGQILARAVERRAVSVTAPRRWQLLSVLRGIINPAVDKRFGTDRRLGELIRDADVEGRHRHSTQGSGPNPWSELPLQSEAGLRIVRPEDAGGARSRQPLCRHWGTLDLS